MNGVTPIISASEWEDILRAHDQSPPMVELQEVALEARRTKLIQIADTRRVLIQDLFNTIKTRQDDFSIKVVAVPDEGSPELEEFVREWDVTDQAIFKSIATFEPSQYLQTVKSPPGSIPQNDFADTSMDVDEDEKQAHESAHGSSAESYSEQVPPELEDEGIVDQDLANIASDDENVRATKLVQNPSIGSTEARMDIDMCDIAPSVLVKEPAKPIEEPPQDKDKEHGSTSLLQVASSRSLSSSSLSEPPASDVIPHPITTIQPEEMHIDSSSIPQSLSTMLATSSSIPHYTVISNLPSRPNSLQPTPSYSDLNIQPHPAPEAKLLPPLLTDYALSLYPLPPAPPSSASSKKQKKKEKERERAAAAAAGMVVSSGGYGSLAAKPMDLPRWQATLITNPVFKYFRKTAKCISSQEWNIAYSELRFLRAMHRVDQMKQAGKWSFRQPKRSKGPALTKVHWDWVLDEVRWLQADFREERKWKLATAFELAHTAAAYHHASSDQKPFLCIKWRPPPLKAPPLEDDVNLEGGLPERLEPTVRTDPDDEPGDEDMEDEYPDTKPSIRQGIEAVAQELALDELNNQNQTHQAPDDVPNEEVKEALEELEASKQQSKEPTIKEEPPTIDIHAFDQNNPDEDGEEDGDGEADVDRDGDGEPDDGAMEISDLLDDTIATGDTATSGLNLGERKSASVGRRSKSRPINGANGSVNGSQKIDLVALRAPLLNRVSLEATTINMSQLSLTTSNGDGDPAGVKTGLRGHPQIKLPELFPELATFGPFVGPIVDSNNSSKLSATKPKDANKRIDEAGTLGKLTYISRLLDIKPVLVSTLQPAKKRKLGGWDDLAEFYPGDDTNPELKPTEYYLPPPAPLFTGPRKPREYPSTHAPVPPKDMRERQATLIWTTEEDAHLKHLAYIYSLNWKLISDAFASWRVGINTDRRTEWDCFERWNRLWGPNGVVNRAQTALAQQQAEAAESQNPDSDSIGARKASRSAQSLFKKPPPPPLQLQMPPGNPMNMSTKKQVRRNFLFEAIKKSSKKRDATLIKGNVAKARVNINVHETHAQVSSVQLLTPQQLGMLKYDRDAKIMMEQDKRRAEHLRAAFGNGRVPLGVSQLRNLQQMQMQQAALQQQLAAQQAQVQAQTQRNGQGAPAGIQRVPTVTQQAMLAQAQAAQAAQQAQVQAQLAATGAGTHNSPPLSSSIPISNANGAPNGVPATSQNNSGMQQVSPTSAVHMMRAQQQFVQQQQQQQQQQSQSSQQSQIANSSPMMSNSGFDMAGNMNMSPGQVQAALAAQQLRIHQQQQIELANSIMQAQAQARVNVQNRNSGTPVSLPANSPPSNS